MRKFIAGLVLGLIVATGSASFAATHGQNPRIVEMQARIQHKDARISHLHHQVEAVRGLEAHYWAVARATPSSIILYGEAAQDMQNVLVGTAH